MIRLLLEVTKNFYFEKQLLNGRDLLRTCGKTQGGVLGENTSIVGFKACLRSSSNKYLCFMET